MRLLEIIGRIYGEGNRQPTLVFPLENPMDRVACQATVRGVARVGHDLASKPNEI